LPRNDHEIRRKTATVSRQKRLGKHVSAVINMHATIEGVFYVVRARSYTQDKWDIELIEFYNEGWKK
jgi:hypothetical protein